MTAIDRHRALLAAASAPRPWYANEHGDIKTGDGDTVLHQDSTLADPEDAALAAAAVNAHPLLLDLWAATKDFFDLNLTTSPPIRDARERDLRAVLAKLEELK